MSDFKQRILRQLASDAGEGTEWALDKLDRPARATRAAIGAFQQDEPVWPAIKQQFAVEPPEAPSGADLAERVGQRYDIENPAVLAALATAADIADPSMLMPGGQVGKLGKVGKMFKPAGKGETAADIVSKAMKKKEVPVVPTAQERYEAAVLEKMGGGRKGNISSIPETKVETNLEEIFGRDEARDLYEQFPQQLDKKFRGKQVIVPKKLMDED